MPRRSLLRLLTGISGEKTVDAVATTEPLMPWCSAVERFAVFHLCRLSTDQGINQLYSSVYPHRKGAPGPVPHRTAPHWATLPCARALNSHPMPIVKIYSSLIRRNASWTPYQNYQKTLPLHWKLIVLCWSVLVIFQLESKICKASFFCRISAPKGVKIEVGKT